MANPVARPRVAAELLCAAGLAGTACVGNKAASPTPAGAVIDAAAERHLSNDANPPEADAEADRSLSDDATAVQDATLVQTVWDGGGFPPPVDCGVPAQLSMGTLKNIYVPKPTDAGAWYINDHTIIRGPDNLWHMIGITHAEPQ